MLFRSLYGTSRRLVLTIGAGGGQILAEVAGEGASVEAALEFIHQVETRRLANAPAPPERPAASSSPTWVSAPE